VNLYTEVISRFPETDQYIGENRDLPYLVMGGIADWLRALPPEEITAEIRQRIGHFSDWCCKSPRTDSADDDIYTMWIVAVFEKLFRSPSTRVLIPSLTTRDQLIASADYLRSWVDETDYKAALLLFDLEAQRSEAPCS
jgi:hypothetical protein